MGTSYNRRMSDTLIFHTSVADYTQLCHSFFDDLESKVQDIHRIVSGMDVHTFKEWHAQILNDYYTHAYTLVGELAQSIRTGYDVYTRTDAENDPLKIEPGKSFFLSYRHTYEQVGDDRFQNLPCVQAQLEVVQRMKLAEQEEKLRHVEVEGEAFRALGTCEVLWSGWESDTRVWVVQQGEKKRLVGSDHGMVQFMEASFLEDRISAYKNAIANSEALLHLISN